MMETLFYVLLTLIVFFAVWAIVEFSLFNRGL